MVLRDGMVCALLDGEETELTAMCIEQVEANLMGFEAVVAVVLKSELKKQTPSEDASAELLRQGCEFYSEDLPPDTNKFCKRAMGMLDV